MSVEKLSIEEITYKRKAYEKRAIEYADSRYYSANHPADQFSKHIFNCGPYGYLFLQWIPSTASPEDTTWTHVIEAHWHIEWVDNIDTYPLYAYYNEVG